MTHLLWIKKDVSVRSDDVATERPAEISISDKINSHRVRADKTKCETVIGLPKLDF